MKSAARCSVLTAILLCSLGCSAGRTADEPVITTLQANGDTGTSHYVRELTITFAGKPPLVLATDVEKGDYAPSVLKVVEVRTHLHVLIGLSSDGAGMQSLQMLAIDSAGPAISLRDRLIYRVERGSPGVALAGAEIAIVIPGQGIHHEDAWELQGSRRSLDITQIRQLTAERRASSALELFGGALSADATVLIHWCDLDSDGRFSAMDKGVTSP